MADFGGTVSFTYAGNPLVMRGHITIGPSSIKADPIANQNGTVSRTLTPRGYTAKFKFEDSTNGLATPQPWDAILKGGPYNVTVVENQTGVTHMWTNAAFTGEPEVDREKGEVDGLSLIAPSYQTITGAG
jgi:hypothetical protein